MINLTEREKIDDICKKRYISSRKRRYEIAKQKYHTHTRLKEELNKLTSDYPDIAAQYSIGSTEQGRDILVLKLTEDVKNERLYLKPQVKFVAGKIVEKNLKPHKFSKAFYFLHYSGIHGDEVVGRELLLYLARTLCEQYKCDSYVTELLRNVEIHLLPSLNTDGYILKTRNNANDKVYCYVYCLCELSVKLIRI